MPIGATKRLGTWRSGDVCKFDCPLAKRTGQHAIYNTWQRFDSAEALYTCTDVRLKAVAA